MAKLNIQDAFLNVIRKEKIGVTVFTTNGVKIQGNILSFDTFTVVILSNKVQQLIFKHAISTIIPAKNISLNFNSSSEEAEENN